MDFEEDEKEKLQVFRVEWNSCSVLPSVSVTNGYVQCAIQFNPREFQTSFTRKRHGR
jgi:hypothetical protein